MTGTQLRLLDSIFSTTAQQHNIFLDSDRHKNIFKPSNSPKPLIVCASLLSTTMAPSNACSKSKKAPAKASNKSVDKKKPFGKGSASQVEDLKEKIIAELSKYHFIKKYSAKTIIVARACGYSSIESKSFRNAKKELKDEGKIVNKGTDMIELSQLMIDKLNNAAMHNNVANNAPKNNTDHHNHIKQMFKDDKNYKNIVKLVDLLSDGGTLPDKEAASFMGYAGTDSKGFRTAKSFLKEAGFLDGGGSKDLSLTDEMFPFGRPNRI